MIQLNSKPITDATMAAGPLAIQRGDSV